MALDYSMSEQVENLSDVVAVTSETAMRIVPIAASLNPAARRGDERTPHKPPLVLP
jgi:hypothetical protein